MISEVFVQNIDDKSSQRQDSFAASIVAHHEVHCKQTSEKMHEMNKKHQGFNHQYQAPPL